MPPTNGDEIRFVSASGSVGSGVQQTALDEAMATAPHFIACDGGTTDAGAFYLGSGESAYPAEAIKDDLAIILKAAAAAQIPVILGSAATAGGDIHVDLTLEIAREILVENNLSMKTAVVYAEQGKSYLEGLAAAKRIRPLRDAPMFDPGLIARSARIVGMMGVEAIQEALETGAQFILTGRCSDAALWAAMPIMRGFPRGLAWHAGKLLECGTSGIVENNRLKGIVACTLRHDHLVVKAFGPGLRCTPQSVAAHSLYENSDPYLHKECAGTLDLSRTIYEAVDEYSVRVSGSAFIPSDEFTVKLEGAELIGYQSVIIGGIRDPLVITQLDNWLLEVRKKIQLSVARVLGRQLKETDYHLVFHVYGRDAVMGVFEPNKQVRPNEVGVVIEVTAASQILATKIAKLCRQPFLHHPIPEWKGSVTTFAFLHNPAYIERGPVYKFNLNHVALPHDQMEMFRLKTLDLGSAVMTQALIA